MSLLFHYRFSGSTAVGASVVVSGEVAVASTSQHQVVGGGGGSAVQIRSDNEDDSWSEPDIAAARKRMGLASLLWKNNLGRHYSKEGNSETDASRRKSIIFEFTVAIYGDGGPLNWCRDCWFTFVTFASVFR